MIKKNKLLFSFIFTLVFYVLLISLTFIIISKSVLATSIQCSNYRFTFYKGYKAEYIYTIGGAERLRSYIGGDLPNYTKYVTLEDDNQDGPPRTFRVKLDLYEDLPPGRYTLGAGGVEIRENQGSVGGVAAMICKIFILVLFPGKYLEWDLFVSNTNINEETNVTFSVTNLGTENISIIYGHAEIYDSEGKHIATVDTNREKINSDTTESVNAKLSTNGYTPGMYTVIGTLFWENTSGIINETKNITFRVGELNVDIVDYTKEFFIDAINKFEVVIKSDWNGGIKDVYALITTPNTADKPLKTPNIDLFNFQQGVLETYWDTTGLDKTKKEFPVKITVYYAGKTTTKDVIVYVNKTGKEVELEKQKPFSLFNLSTTGTIYIIISILLIIVLIFNILLLVYKEKIGKKNYNGNNPKETNTTEQRIIEKQITEPK
ncbi:MAG: hypothetical protein QXG00_03960 [Candidatus Woesearchaeota archaeon]